MILSWTGWCLCSWANLFLSYCYNLFSWWKWVILRWTIIPSKEVLHTLQNLENWLYEPLTHSEPLHFFKIYFAYWCAYCSSASVMKLTFCDSNPENPVYLFCTHFLQCMEFILIPFLYTEQNHLHEDIKVLSSLLLTKTLVYVEGSHV